MALCSVNRTKQKPTALPITTAFLAEAACLANYQNAHVCQIHILVIEFWLLGLSGWRPNWYGGGLVDMWPSALRLF